MIKKVRNNKWYLYSKDGKKILGMHNSKESALKQERAIHLNKMIKDFTISLNKQFSKPTKELKLPLMERHNGEHPLETRGMRDKPKGHPARISEPYKVIEPPLKNDVLSLSHYIKKILENPD